MDEIPEEYTLDVIIVPPLLVAANPDSIKNLKEWSITSSILSIIGATLLGGTFLGHTLPLIFGSVGGVMIAVGVLIEEIKFGGFIRSIKKKGVPMKMRYCKIIKKESAVNGYLQEEEASAQV